MLRHKLKSSISIILATSVVFSNMVYAYTPSVQQGSSVTYRENNSKVNQIHKIDAQDTLVASNPNLNLYVNQQDLSIKVFDKNANYIYSSNDVSTENINTLWTNYVNSPVVIECYDKQQAVVQETIYDSERSTMKYTPIENGFKADLYFGISNISLSYTVTLEDEGISIHLDNESIIQNKTAKSVAEQQALIEDVNEEELTTMEKAELKGIKSDDSSYDLKSLTFYPFMGAVTTGQQDGYTFVPSGMGSLIGYEGYYPNLSESMNLNFYGSDIAFDNFQNNSDFNNEVYEWVPLPLYGMVHGIDQTGYLNIIEDGSEEARLLSSPAGYITDYFYTTVYYDYNEKYEQSISATETVSAILDEPKQFDITEKYIFVNDDEANYAGLAVTYRDYLVENDLIKENELDSIPMYIETYMGGYEKGFLRNKNVAVTDTDEIIEMNKYFTDNGVDSVMFNMLTGVTKFDYTGKVKDLDNISSVAEDEHTIQEMNEYLASTGSRALLGIDTWYLPAKTSTEYIMRKVNKEYMEGVGHNSSPWTYLNYKGADMIVDSAIKVIEKVGFAGAVNFNTGISSNFEKEETMYRKDSIDAIQTSMEKLNQVGILGERMPTYHKFDSINFATYIDTDSFYYSYITETVPFYQIVLSGYIPMFSMPLNYKSDINSEMLKLIEYNVYPTYLVADKEENELNNTATKSYGDVQYLMRYDYLKEGMLESYKYIENILGEVVGESIINHEAIADDVVAVTYTNGKTIVVNYSDTPYNYEGVTVEGKGCVVK